ncbi:hypothetical protein H1R20_g7901, partial [Candolleomyces eurysporus]
MDPASFATLILELVHAQQAVKYITVASIALVACRWSFIAAAVLGMVGATISEAILFYRVYALAGRTPGSRAFLFLLFFSVNVVKFSALGKFIVSVQYAPSPIPAFIGCFPVKADNVMLSIVAALILGNELIILLITFWVGFRKYAGLRSPLISIFYRDGVAYFFCIAAISAGNIICILVAPPAYMYLLAV